jgi:uroporphyrinogen decarboxylase
MESRERVHAVIRHETPDRIPVYGWVMANLNEEITREFGSVAEFEDRYEFDFAHLFGGPPTFLPETLQAARETGGGAIDPPAAVDLPMTDPNDQSAYGDLVDQVRRHKEERGRWVYVQTPGIFEALNGVYGIENHLMHMALYPDALRETYRKQAEWNKQFALNCLELGVDQVHVSDDWGQQSGLMFSLDMWREFIFPYHKPTCDAVKQAGGVLSLHTDGNVNDVIDGIIELGYDVVHPWQESAGMDLADFKANYRDVFTVMGGLDVQTTIGFGDFDRLEREIKRVLTMFQDGGLLYCTSHFVQDHCSMEELTFAFDTIYRTVRELANG